MLASVESCKQTAVQTATMNPDNAVHEVHEDKLYDYSSGLSLGTIKLGVLTMGTYRPGRGNSREGCVHTEQERTGAMYGR